MTNIGQDPPGFDRAGYQRSSIARSIPFWDSTSTGDNGRMSRVFFCLALALIACAPAPNFAGLKMDSRRAELRERILARTLQNGLRVVVLPDVRTNLVMVGVRYSVGGADDPREGEGLAHYVEHVLFNAAFQGEDGNVLRDVGLEANAMTSADRTFFYMTALESDIDSALEIAARRFEARCDDFDDATLERERDVVIEENKLRSGHDSMAAALRQTVWGEGHPYGHDAGGTDFARLPRTKLCQFRARKKVLARSLALPAGASSRADALQRVVIAGGNVHNLAQETDDIRALDAAALQKVAAQYLQPQAMVVAARGKQSAVEAALTALGAPKAKIEWIAPR